jgi:hypothetical protein
VFIAIDRRVANGFIIELVAVGGMLRRKNDLVEASRAGDLMKTVG